MTKTAPRETRCNTAQPLEALLIRIAQGHLFLGSLETRQSDSLDFPEMSIWGIEQALIATHQVGQKAA